MKFLLDIFQKCSRYLRIMCETTHYGTVLYHLIILHCSTLLKCLFVN